MKNKEITDKEDYNSDRRIFLHKGLMLTAVVGAGGLGLITSCNKEEESEEISPEEDLMQEHGILKRIMLIYDTCRLHLLNQETFPIEAISNSAGIIRSFIEDHHEKEEEDFIFPRFQKANKLTDLVAILLEQHKAGRKVTEQILQISKVANRTDVENKRLAELLSMFNIMYNPHEAREDTVLFPSLRKILSRNEYDSLREDFEKNEKKSFGEDGFDTMVSKVTEIEKSLNIYDLNRYTPKL